jgi:cell division protein FtsN
MKRALILIIVTAVMMVSCKSSKKATTSPYTPATQETTTTPQPKIFTIPDTKNTVPAAKEEPTIPVRKESFSFTQPQDNTQNNFFIIVGSFSSLDNAKSFKQTLVSEGFTPIIVQSETGFYRVTTDSFNNETDARKRLLQVRENYPKYADTWLLIKQ